MGRVKCSLFFNYLCLYAFSSDAIKRKRQIGQECEVSDKFGCDNGICIPEEKACDGFNDCQDDSDESFRACKCGLSSAPEIESRAVSTPVKKINYYPWHAGIYLDRNEHNVQLLCSGVLINRRFVITSASCLYVKDLKGFISASSLKVSLGKLKKFYHSSESNHKSFQVEQVIHGEYQGDRQFYANNFAVVQLKEKAEFLPNISPICLWTQNDLPSNLHGATLTGWDLQFEPSFSSSDLLQVKLEYLNNRQCKEKFRSIQIHKYLKYDKGCLLLENDVGISFQDLGGPVIIKKDFRHFLIGIISNLIPDQPRLVVVNEIGKRVSWIKNMTNAVGHKAHTAGCTKNYFQCGDSCLPENKVCDGIRDCPNNSDESNCQVSRPTDIGPQKQLCSKLDTNAEFTLEYCGIKGQCSNPFKVPHDSRFMIMCPKNYSFLDDSNSVRTICVDGTWIPSLPVCYKTCHLEKRKSLKFACEYRGIPVESCEGKLKAWTKVKVDCSRGYKLKSLSSVVTEFSCQPDGQFTRVLTDCIPECGKLNEAGIYEPLILGGKASTPGKFPWYIALYWRDNDKVTFKCGATLLSSSKVLTAAHCVYQRYYGMVEPKKLLVSAAKYNNNLNKYDEFEQRRNVTSIHVMDSYKDTENSYLEDIAILQLDEDLPLSTFIMPACIDIEGSLKGPHNGQLGLLAGFGATTDGPGGQASAYLKETELEYLSFSSCKEVTKGHTFNRYILPDKFCTLAKGESKGVPLQGDSGGGLTFEINDFYYIYGIVSIRSPELKNITVFTDVRKHIEWIAKHFYT